MAILTQKEIVSTLSTLANKGNTYTCEAQFQFDLADELRKYFSEHQVGHIIYLEYPCSANGRTEYFDIVIEDASVEPHEYCIIELKYKTKAAPATCYGQSFTLKTHAAQGLGRYDYLNDVSRIEQFSSKYNKKIQNGFAIILTNDRQYWAQSGKGKSYAEFSLKDGATQISGHKKWAQGISPNSTGAHRINGLDLSKSYQINWSQWGQIPNFKYLLLEI